MATGDTTVVLKLVGDASSLRKAIDSVDRELAQLVVQTDRAQAALGSNLAKGTQQATKNLNQFTNAQRSASRAGRQSRANLQNLGFQLQDIAVQAEAGTDGLRIFAQQGSQILGIFGPTATIIGAVAAAGIAAGKAFGVFGKEVKDTSEAVKELLESFNELNEIQEKLAEDSSGPGSEILQQLREAQEQGAVGDIVASMRELEETIVRIGQKENSIGFLDRLIAVAGGGIGSAIAAAQLSANLAAAKADAKEIEDAIRGITELDAGEDILQSFDDTVDRARELFGVESDIYRQLLTMVDAVAAYAAQRDEAAKTAEQERIVGEGLVKNYIALSTSAANRLAAEVQVREALKDEDIIMGLMVEKSAAMVELTKRRKELLDSISDREFISAEDTLFSLPVEIDKKNIPRKTRGGGGGKSQAEKDREQAVRDAEKLAEALAKAREEADQFGQSLEENLGGLLSDSIDNFIDGLAAGELAFDKFAAAIVRDLAKMILRAAILQALLSAIGVTPGRPDNILQSVISSAAGIGRIDDSFAKGGVFNTGNVVPFANGGVVSGPTVFPMTGGTGLMGEAGPEAIMPLQRNSQGQLGVAGPSITINNNAGADISVVRSDEEVIEIAVNRARQEVQAEFAQSMQTGQGSYSRSLEQGYTARRRAT